MKQLLVTFQIQKTTTRNSKTTFIENEFYTFQNAKVVPYRIGLQIKPTNHIQSVLNCTLHLGTAICRYKIIVIYQNKAEPRHSGQSVPKCSITCQESYTTSSVLLIFTLSQDFYFLPYPSRPKSKTFAVLGVCGRYISDYLIIQLSKIQQLAFSSMI